MGGTGYGVQGTQEDENRVATARKKNVAAWIIWRKSYYFDIITNNIIFMKPFMDIGEFDKKRISYKRNIALNKDISTAEAYSYIIQKGLGFLPTHETMDFIDSSDKFSLFNVIVAATTMSWMIDIQKQEQAAYRESFTQNWENGDIGDRRITYSNGSDIKFEIDGWANVLKSKLISALTGKYYSDITVRKKWTEKCAKIDIIDIMNAVFWTLFVQKIQSLHQVQDTLSLQIDVVYEEVNDYLLSAEERNNLINEALYGMLEAFDKITIIPTP